MNFNLESKIKEIKNWFNKPCNTDHLSLSEEILVKYIYGKHKLFLKHLPIKHTKSGILDDSVYIRLEIPYETNLDFSKHESFDKIDYSKDAFIIHLYIFPEDANPSNSLKVRFKEKFSRLNSLLAIKSLEIADYNDHLYREIQYLVKKYKKLYELKCSFRLSNLLE